MATAVAAADGGEFLSLDAMGFRRAHRRRRNICSRPIAWRSAGRKLSRARRVRWYDLPMAHETDFGCDLGNASIPAATVVPVLNYADVTAAAAWLCRAFGFTQRLRIGDHRIQLSVGSGAIVVAKLDSNAGRTEPANHSIMVRVSNVDGHFQKATTEGATVSGEPASMPYGERQYSAIDLGGHRWTFSQTEADVDPHLWGGVLLDDA